MDVEQEEKHSKKHYMFIAKDRSKSAIKRLKEAENALQETMEALSLLDLYDLGNFFGKTKEDLSQLRSEAEEVVNFELTPQTDSLINEIDDTIEEVKPKKKIKLVFE